MRVLRSLLAIGCALALTAQFQRTKKRSLGVNTPWSNTSNGVSRSGGCVRWRIISVARGMGR